MSKKINFFAPEGKTVSKRKRMSGTDASKKPEIKQSNVIQGEYQNYSAITLTPIVAVSGGVKPTNVMAPYRLHMLKYPVTGTEGYERIGNSIFLRNLRLKGYVAVSSRVFRPINWKLYLYRFEGLSPYDEDDDTNFALATDHYFELFKNVQTYNGTISANNARINSRHNFYKKVRKMPKDYTYTCKCIASGVIPMTNEAGITSYTGVGSGAQVGVIAPLKTASSEDMGCMSLDVNVKLNDRITFIQANSTYTPTGWTANAYYYLAFEDDFGVGQTVSYTSVSTPIANSVALSNTVADKCYSVEFWGRWFYQDD